MASTKQKYARYRRAHEAAHAAGMKAGAEAIPSPMVVSEAEPLTGRPLRGGQSWYVSEGVCGFAWITVRPGNSSLANWLKKAGLASKAYRGGVSIWVGHFGQSYTRKMAYARAYAKSLRESLRESFPELQDKVSIWADGRLD